MSRSPTAVSGKALSGRTRSTSSSRGCLIVVFGFFALIGAVFFYWSFWRPFAEYRASRAWAETPCTIVASEVKSETDSDGTRYWPKIRYRYTFGGGQFESDRVQFFAARSSRPTDAQQLVARYPAGRRTMCYVNPQRPIDAVLLREGPSSSMMASLLIPLIFLLVGVGGVLVLWLRGRAVRRAADAERSRDQFPRPGEAIVTAAQQQRLAAGARDREAELTDAPISVAGQRFDRDAGEESGADSDEYEEDEDEELDEPSFIAPRAAPGPVTLHPATTPLKSFLLTLGIATFWNGILSVFVYQAVAGFLRGRPEWFLSLFLLPFLAIGIVLLLATLHTFLSLFNPRPQLTLLNGDLSLGDAVEVRWHFTGNTGSLRQLRIELKGTEKATYRRGTSTHTDTEVFARLAVVETAHPATMAAGTASATIPRRTMHSFTANHNEVIWAVRIHGTIAFWPDVDVEFPITIHPAPPI